MSARYRQDPEPILSTIMLEQYVHVLNVVGEGKGPQRNVLLQLVMVAGRKMEWVHDIKCAIVYVYHPQVQVSEDGDGNLSSASGLDTH